MINDVRSHRRVPAYKLLVHTAVMWIATVASPVFAQSDASHLSTVRVSGEYRVSKAPDMARIKFTIVKQAKEAALAKQAADTLLLDVKRVIESAGIDGKHLSTINASMQPRYLYREGQQRILQGFDASYMLQLNVERLEILGSVIERLVVTGIERIETIEYALKDDSTAKDEALVLAVGDAKRKATLLAKAANVTLGTPVMIQEGAVHASLTPFMMRSMPMVSGALMESSHTGASPPPQGELDIYAQVSIVYALED